ncbi:hypothetical protein AVEN_244608-1, partial [Araneus ventricosus]
MPYKLQRFGFRRRCHGSVERRNPSVPRTACLLPAPWVRFCHLLPAFPSVPACSCHRHATPVCLMPQCILCRLRFINAFHSFIPPCRSSRCPRGFCIAGRASPCLHDYGTGFCDWISWFWFIPAYAARSVAPFACCLRLLGVACGWFRANLIPACLVPAAPAAYTSRVAVPAAF